MCWKQRAAQTKIGPKIAFRLREPSVNFVQNSGNTFSSSELQEDSVCANFAHTAEDGHEIKKELK